METNLHKLKEETKKSPSIDSTLFKKMIGSLMYLVNTRPNIFYVVNALSQFMCEPKEIHLVAIKHIMRYLQHTLNFGLKYEKFSLHLHGFTDLDWGGSVKYKKSASRCYFNLGSAMISWICKKKFSVAQSSTEAEYITTLMASQEEVWMRKLLVGLFWQAMDPTIIHCDNQSSIKLSVNLGSKHIEVF